MILCQHGVGLLVADLEDEIVLLPARLCNHASLVQELKISPVKGQ